jgi:hypothetical protein
MKSSLSLGIAGIVLVAIFLFLPFWVGYMPIGWIAGAVAAALGFTASRNGSKWWLLIPASVVVAIIIFAILAVD